MMEIHFSGKGNAVGFTSKGETIVCRKARKQYCPATYMVWIDGPLMMTDSRTRNFGTLAEGRAYAASLIDVEQTELLAWWL